MDKGEIALRIVTELCRHLAMKGILSKDDGTTIINGTMEFAVGTGDMDAVDAIDRIERVIFECAPE